MKVRTYPVRSLRKTGTATPRLPRQALDHVHAEPESPGDGEHAAEEINADDDGPRGRSARMHLVSGVQAAHEEHEERDQRAAHEARRLAPPHVAHERGGDGDEQEDQGADARGEEARLRGVEPGLREQDRRVVEHAVDAAELLHAHDEAPEDGAAPHRGRERLLELAQRVSDALHERRVGGVLETRCYGLGEELLLLFFGEAQVLDHGARLLDLSLREEPSRALGNEGGGRCVGEGDACLYGERQAPRQRTSHVGRAVAHEVSD